MKGCSFLALCSFFFTKKLGLGLGLDLIMELPMHVPYNMTFSYFFVTQLAQFDLSLLFVFFRTINFFFIIKLINCHLLLLPAGVRDYIHVVDLAVGHVAALNKLDENCGCKVSFN